uniref:THIF-type NAD/FAD binding fold domain-containing protein n=1 Tax=Glossina palpalis gambiensis TaxID=67801 RepID=A0A1B0C4K0_9MUSC
MAVFNVWILMRLSEKSDCRVEHRDFQPKLSLFLTQQQLKQRLESKQKLSVSLKLQITEVQEARNLLDEGDTRRAPFCCNKNFNLLAYVMIKNWNESQIWQVQQTIEGDDYLKEFNNKNLKFVGQELNCNRKLQPRMISMKESMDPTTIKFRKSKFKTNERLLPDLNLNILATTKCLLFGADTLGYDVALLLLIDVFLFNTSSTFDNNKDFSGMGGFERIFCVDGGKVSFSNPMRQYLYTRQDACKDNIIKSTIAAERIKEINPSVNSSGYVLNMPMPGHPIGKRLKEQTIKDLSKLKDLAQQHHALESRWLPTLLGKAYRKIGTKAALGFGSYLVQRHGSTRRVEKIDDTATEVQVDNLRCIKGEDLGCYFCNDWIYKYPCLRFKL